MLERMVEAELIVKKRDEKDRRNTRIFLTAKGKLMKQKINVAKSKMDKELETEHSPEEIETAKKVLTTLYHRLLKQSGH